MLHLRSLLLLLVPLTAQAQSYDQLWRSVEQAMRKDLPKTVLQQLEIIRTKAERERNEVQLLRSYLISYGQKEELSFDSVKPAIERLETYAERASTPLMRALWLNAAARVRENYSFAAPEEERRTKELFLASLADLDILAKARTKDFIPLFVEGKQSALFKGDLLHALTFEVLEEMHFLTDKERRALRLRLADFYEQRGNRAVALAFRLEELSNAASYDDESLADEERFSPEERYKQAVRLANDYEDCPNNVFTYVLLHRLLDGELEDDFFASSEEAATEMRNRLRYECLSKGIALYKASPYVNELRREMDALCQPMLGVEVASETHYPHRPIKVTLSGRRQLGGELQVRRIDGLSWSEVEKRYNDSNRYNALAAKSTLVPTSRRTIAWQTAAPYVTQQQEVMLDGLEAGCYLLELKVGGKIVDRKVFPVTALQSLTLQTDAGDRVIVVDGQTGAPLTDATLRKWEILDNDKLTQQVISANERGEFFLPAMKLGSYRQTSYYPETPTDRNGTEAELQRYYYGNEVETLRQKTEVFAFTDRAIYRPGQKVETSAIIYRQQGDETAVVKDEEVKFFLRDANRKVVAEAMGRTDAFGVAKASFDLPTRGLWGRWTIETKAEGERSLASLRVEEYKRPTLVATLLRPQEGYTLGGETAVKGTLKTYADFPIEGAKVSYTIEQVTYLYRRRTGKRLAPQIGETTTDADGSFTIPVRLPDDLSEPSSAMSVKVVLTAPNGETVEEHVQLPLAQHTSVLSVSWGRQLCKEDLPRVKVEQITAQHTLLATTGRYEFRRAGQTVLSGTFRTGEAFVPDVKALPTGEYEVVTATDVQEEGVPSQCRAITTDTTTVFLFSENDRELPLADQPLFTHSRLSEDGRTLSLWYATGLQGVTAFYDIVTKDGVVHSERIALTNEVVRRTVELKEEWGDDTQVSLMFLRDGKFYSTGRRIERPRPKKKLVARWKTFRSTLTPGQEEEWTLRITQPDGRPADASLMATMYDASLDAFAPLQWAFNVSFHRERSRSESRVGATPWLQLYHSLELPFRETPSPEFSHWNQKFFGRHFRFMAESAKMYDLQSVGANNAAPVGRKLMEGSVMVRGGAKIAPTASVGSNPALPLRRNFNETAFFQPALRTNERGEVVLRFRLPESTTTWNVRALAHTAGVDYAALDTTAVARKEFTLTPALPRFLRQGDRTEIPATLQNLSSAEAKGTLRLTLLDAQTLAEVRTETMPFALAAGQGRTLSFHLDTPEGVDALIVRMTAEGKRFSDGEEHILPILADRHEAVRTVPFTLRGRTTLTVPLANLWDKGATHRRLIVETTSNPLWQVAAALPFVYEVNPRNVLDWAAQYHASLLAHHLVQQEPRLLALAKESKETTSAWSERLRQNDDLRHLLIDETPWSPLADAEAQRTEKLQTLFDEASYETRTNEALTKIASMQNSDGGWSWYPGMKSNAYTTLAITRLLVRGHLLTGAEEGDRFLPSAFAYLENVIQKSFKEQPPVIGSFHYEYLYLRALAHELDLLPLPESAAVIQKAMVRSLGSLSMEQKAVAAVTLSILGQRKEADLALQSLMEHTVATAEMGRYFDSYRTRFSASQYATSTQVAMIETLLRLRPTDDAIAELRLWLLQSKRARHWATTETTMDAIYALLGGGKQPAVASLATAAPLHVTARAKGKALPNPTTEAPNQPHIGLAGYGRAFYDVAATEVRIEKTDDGLAWGTVYAQSLAPASTATASASELGVNRFFERETTDGWVRLREGESVGRGEKLRAVYEVRAERDFDFVSLRAPRPAGTVPVYPLSGYRWTAVGAVYEVVHDASNDYFIEHLRKGSYRLTATLRTDRSGRFLAAPARLQSVYAPEFVGYSTSATLTVK